MVHILCLFMKTHLLVLLQDHCLGLLCFLAQVVWMCEEYDSILSTPTKAEKNWPFWPILIIGKTKISGRYIDLSLVLVPHQYLRPQHHCWCY